MKLKEFLSILKIPVLLIGIMIVIFSFMSYLIGFELVLVKDMGLVTWVIYDVFYHLDFTHDFTFASWFISFIIMLIAFGFFLIGFNSNEKIELSSFQQRILKSFSVICFFMSADQVLRLRYNIGIKIEDTLGFLDNTKIEYLGYSWILIFIPLVIIFYIFFIPIINKLITNIRNVKERRVTAKYFKLVSLLIPIYLISVILEAYLLYSGSSISFFLYLKGFTKIVMVYSIFTLVEKIVDNNNL